jgi:hypothetical protein
VRVLFDLRDEVSCVVPVCDIIATKIEFSESSV